MKLKMQAEVENNRMTTVCVTVTTGTVCLRQVAVRKDSEGNTVQTANYHDKSEIKRCNLKGKLLNVI